MNVKLEYGDLEENGKMSKRGKEKEIEAFSFLSALLIVIRASSVMISHHMSDF